MDMIAPVAHSTRCGSTFTYLDILLSTKNMTSWLAMSCAKGTYSGIMRAVCAR